MYTWSTGAPFKENGTAFTSLLASLNFGGSGGSSGWRLPTLAELQTILPDFECTSTDRLPTCTCPSVPCIDPALDPANTKSFVYWAASSHIVYPEWAWGINFADADVVVGDKTDLYYARGVRGGW